MTDKTDKTEKLIREFTQAIVDAVIRDTLDGLAHGPARRAPAPNGRAAPPRTKGGRRSPEQLQAERDRLLAVIKANPGKRSEELQELTVMTAEALARPITQLLKMKKLRHEGVARGRRYWAR